MTKGKTIFSIGLIVVLLALLIISGIYVGVQSSLPDSKYIEVPAFGWYSCDPLGSRITVPSSGTGYSVADTTAGTRTSCGTFGETTECTFAVTAPKEGLFTSERRVRVEVCDANGQNCEQIINPTMDDAFGTQVTYRYTASTDNIVSLHYERLKAFTFTTWIPVESSKAVATYTVSFQPYALKKSSTFDGGRTTVNSANCEFTSTSQTSLLALKSSIEELASSGKSVDKLSPNQEFNFISRYVPISRENPAFQTYAGATVYCTDDTLYKIETVDTPSGQYQIVQSDFNTALTTVDCCNGDNTPTQTCVNNHWVDTVGVECSAFNPCGGSDPSPIRGEPTKVISYSCVGGQCESEIQEVECTQNSQCGGGVCDETFECTKVEQGDLPLMLPSLSPSIVDLSFLGSTLFYISIMIGAIGMVLVYLTAIKFFPKQKQIVTLLAVLGGILIGFLFYMFWILAVIFLVLLIVIRVALGGLKI